MKKALLIIRDRLKLVDEMNLVLPAGVSLQTINVRLMHIKLPPDLANKGIRTILNISKFLTDKDSGFTNGEAIRLVTIMDRISAVLFAPQPEPPRVVNQGFDIMERISSVLFAPQPEPPRISAKGLKILDRISAVLFAPQPEPPRVAFEAFDIMARISAVLFAPQPEPPRFSSQAFNIMDRISAVLFAPQPEPPRVAFDLEKAVFVVYRVSGVVAWTNKNGVSSVTVPGMTELDQLSGHLVTAVAWGQRGKAAAQVKAMSDIARQYASY